MATLANETNKRYGRLLVLSEAGRSDHGLVTWLCQCDCGKQNIVAGASLRNGRTRSCGCLNVERLMARAGDQPMRVKAMFYAFNTMKQNAKHRAITWQIPDDVLEHLCAQNCHYCDVQPSNKGAARFGGAYVFSGIDRLDNLRGYSVDNVVPCCSVCNVAKSDQAMPDFLCWVSRISSNIMKSKGNPHGDVL